jgi:hypothetical protein
MRDQEFDREETDELEDGDVLDDALEIPLPPDEDPIEEILDEIELAPEELSPSLREIWTRGYTYARQALLGSAETADELNVLGWACAWTAYRGHRASVWTEGAEALRRAPTAPGDDAARERAANTLRHLTRAAARLGIRP